MKIAFDSLSYREGKPSPQQLGLTPINFCNRGFYGLNSSGQISYDIPPNPASIDSTVRALPANESIYFDLEPWLCLPDNASEYDKVRKKMYCVELLNKFREVNPTFSRLLGVFGIPDGNAHPENPAWLTEQWKQKNRRLMSGEVWNLLYARMNCMMPCLYSTDYGNGNMARTNELQFIYNQLQLDIIKEANVNNYPVYAFWQPRLKKADGSRPFMSYEQTLQQMNWILTRCNGVVLWDWDGQIDPATGDIAVWDDDFPWFKAVKDSLHSFNNTVIVNQTMTVGSGTPFTRNGKTL